MTPFLHFVLLLTVRREAEYELYIFSVFILAKLYLIKREGEKNLFKYNSCLEGKTSILSVSFVKLKSTGCVLKRHFFGAPNLILCLTGVSINTW